MKKINRYAHVLTICIILVFILICSAMPFYPIPYLWQKDFLSALGLTKLPNGMPNLVSSLLFNFALILSSIMSAGYFILRGNYSSSKIQKYLLWLFGIISGIGLFGIGIFPYNINPDIHNLCTFIAAGGIGPAIFLSIHSGKKLHFRTSEDILWCIFGGFVVIIWFTLAYLHACKMLPSTPIAQVNQKMIIAFYWIYMFWNSIILITRTKNKN
ncbi:MAG: hypothetical protein WCS73_05480 [Lentisphaeria bacterium]